MRTSLGLASLVSVVVVVGAAAPACVGDDPVSSLGIDGGGGGGDGGGDADLPPSPPEPPPPCDAAARPEAGVFVSSVVGLSTGDGSASLPVASIADGLAIAAAKGARHLHLDEGTYREALVLDDRAAGITIHGGWKAGSTWTRDCADGFRARTVIAAPGATAVTVAPTSASAAPVALEAMTITTALLPRAADDAPGGTTYGIRVERGTLRLDVVRVVAGRGGGAGSATRPAAAGNEACDPIASCKGGAPGAAAGPPGAAAAPGRLDASGWVPGGGSDGAPGSAGESGAPGAVNQKSCLVNCAGQCQSSDGCVCGAPVAVNGERGRCGCAGLGGAAGRGGKGGGASIALFVADGATVSVASSNLTASGGGAGAAGGAGGAGGLGTPGVAGATKACHQQWGRSGNVGPACACVPSNDVGIPGGAGGGAGGAGSDGSGGGGGAGGSVYGAAIVGRGKVVFDAASVFALGEPGVGGPGAPSGEKRERVDLP